MMVFGLASYLHLILALFQGCIVYVVTLVIFEIISLLIFCFIVQKKFESYYASDYR